MYEMKIQDNFQADGVDIYITEKAPGGRVWLTAKGDRMTWQAVTPATSVTVSCPTLTLTDDAAKELLNELLRHYAGSEDLRTVRSDLMHERRRVDQYQAAVLQILTHAIGGGVSDEMRSHP